jgi:hypothetical protein
MQVSGEMLQEVCLVVVVQGDDELLRSLATTSKEAGELLASMIKDSSSPLPDHVHQVSTTPWYLQAWRAFLHIPRTR